MKDEALKLALEALITITDAIYVNSQQEADAVYKANDAITAIKAALAQPAPVQEFGLTRERFNALEAEITTLQADWLFAVKEVVRLKAAQREQERNFCERCGKRTADLTTIHTCTPPQEKNNAA